MSEAAVGLTRPQQGVALLTLQRPAARNALDWQTWEQLQTSLAEIEADENTRALVITGAGGYFCAGGDIKSPPVRGKGLGAPAARLITGQKVLRALVELPKPVIAAVEGPAFGAGWSLALACDIVLTAEDASFSAAFVLRGLVPDAGAAWFLTRTLGRHRACPLLFTGQRLSTAQAEQYGLVSEICPPGQALTQATELAARLAAGPPEALRLTKGLVRGAQDLSLERFLEMEWLAATVDLTGPDAAEGRAAFREKREPDFSRLRE
jgi:2-(1,2-epoxy-1,2-dihydrophenyl)acetyl-CoA isomerase